MSKTRTPLFLLMLLFSGALPLPLAASEKPLNVISPIIPLSPEHIELLLARLKAESKTIKALRAPFTQVMRSAMLQEPQTAKGILLFKRPMAIRYEYENGNVFALEKGEFCYWMPARKEAGRLDLRRYEKQLAKFLDPLGMIDKIGTDYALKGGLQSKRGIELFLAPGKKVRRAGFTEIVITLRERPPEEPLIFSRVAVTLKNGDAIELDFGLPEINPPLQADAFSVKIPPGVAIRQTLPDGSLNF